MLKNILKLKGVEEITKIEQKRINRGNVACKPDPCPEGYCCSSTLS
ncbi:MULTISPECIES: hypothetical protein [Flavobacterium]|nr:MULTISPECIES: hypothetical protein [Flavobacterium]UOK43462.1 hypothetical protein LZF87_04905 [Flavobacterium enshiense]